MLLCIGNGSIKCQCFLFAGKDNQEDRAEDGVRRMQVPQADPAQALQALRAWW